MILSAQELFVMVERQRNADFVAGGTELGGFMQRLEKGFLMKLRFGFDQLPVQRTQHSIFR